MTGTQQDLFKDLEFAVTLEQMKKIERRTRIIGEARHENDAEHSWHISVMAMILKDYADEELRDLIDIDRVIKMLLVHDIVEIYAGDTFAYDGKNSDGKKEREGRAMERIMKQLSPQNAGQVNDLWKEFESMQTANSLFANAMDRVQPMLSNIYSGNGGTWREFGVSKTQILKRLEPVAKVSQKLYAYLLSEIEKNIEKGFIKAE